MPTIAAIGSSMASFLDINILFFVVDIGLFGGPWSPLLLLGGSHCHCRKMRSLEVDVVQVEVG